MQLRKATVLSALAIATCLSAVAQAQQWGDLSGQFTFAGNPPAAEKIVVTKDVQVCSKHPLIDEALVVGEEGGVANVVVYLRQGPSDDVKVHPDLVAKLPEQVACDNVNCRFTPHILPVWVGHQTVILKNSDPVAHNTNLQALRNTGVNVLLPASGGETEYTFDVEENLPVSVSCNIHPWMKGWIVPRDNPYVAISDKNGKFNLEKLPAGEWTFQVWHEKAGYVNARDWGRRGRFTIEIKPGKNDLGEIKLDPAIFEK